MINVYIVVHKDKFSGHIDIFVVMDKLGAKMVKIALELFTNYINNSILVE